MASNGLFPAFMRLSYTTPYAKHTLTRALREITYSGVGDFGTVICWDDSVVATDDMCDAFVTAWLAYQPEGTTADYYDVFVVPTIGADPLFLFSKGVADTGAIVAPEGRAAAIQHTMTFKTSIGEDFKIISLDRNSSNTLSSNTTLGTQEAAFRDYILGSTHALAGQDDGRPQAFRSKSITENNRLRRSYGKYLP